jgi:Reverse transcriptase (RNA-dependent DNA polymerase)
MSEELDDLHKHSTFFYYPLFTGKKAIFVCWVFKIKYQADGFIERFKIRLIAKNYKQRYSKDYFNIYVLIARTISVRIVMAIAVQSRLKLEQILMVFFSIV